MAALAYFITTLRAKFEEKEKGATIVEYGLVLAVISLVLLASAYFLTDAMDGLWEAIGGKLTVTE